PAYPTPVTFCEIFPPDNFPLYFYRFPKAPDLEINADELDYDAIRLAGVFWVTVTGLSEEPSRTATLAALEARGRRGSTVLDLDYRPMFWPSREAARPWVQQALAHATVAVGNLDEVHTAVGETEPGSAAKALRALGVELAVVKQGPRGVLAVDGTGAVVVPPVPVEVVNGLGAGDAFGGALRAGTRPMAMADRGDLLERLCIALSRPGVNGVLGTADVLEDLLLLGAIDGKVAIGSMNRGGLAGTVFEIDDRFTGYDAATIAAMNLDGGKMLLRIDPDDPATAPTLEACGNAVTALAAPRLVAMVEPFISHRVDGRIRNDLTPEAMIRAITVSSGLGATSAYTWLKVPVVDAMERVMAASTLPALLLGG